MEKEGMATRIINHNLTVGGIMYDLFFFGGLVLIAICMGCEEPQVEYECECSVECDEVEKTGEAPGPYCGTESDAEQFVDEAIEECGRLLEQGDFASMCDEYGCVCRCEPSGKDC